MGTANKALENYSMKLIFYLHVLALFCPFRLPP